MAQPSHLPKIPRALRSRKRDCRSLGYSLVYVDNTNFEIHTHAKRANLLFVWVALRCITSEAMDILVMISLTYLLETTPVLISEYNAVILESPLMNLVTCETLVSVCEGIGAYYCCFEIR